MTLQLHRPDGKGGLQPTSGRDPRWRSGLRARRWRVAALGNTEMNPTSTFVAVLFWLALAALTFGLLMWGYGTHFWR
jgi:hypothetical protein